VSLRLDALAFVRAAKGSELPSVANDEEDEAEPDDFPEG
jgi:hypothetical protein